ncbi:hypothetical protein INR49_014325 [Caranx melampygus]|nr:hypothetical protein INR49_014325 [Caranx melampygus]
MMMEEVSVMMAYDAQVMEQMSEEEILACLVAETGPKFTVPTKKAKLGESRLQIMDDEDTLDKYQKENHRLQQASLRLEQENDNLAHRLISSKVALRNALDKLKEVFRRELEKAEQEVRRSSGIVADYKQICSQLTNRLERQQAAHKEELDSLKSAATACARCQHVLERYKAPTAGQTSPTEGQGLSEPGQGEKDEVLEKPERKREDQETKSFKAQIRSLERELAQTKLQMVEAKCKIQELEHQKALLTNDLQEAKNSWISKAFTSLRTSSGGLHGIGVTKDGGPALGWTLHSGPLSGWSGKKLSWPHRDNRENLWYCQFPTLKLLTDYIINVTAVYSGGSSSYFTSFMLEEIVKPDPPEHVRVSPHNSRDLLVEWSPPCTWPNLDIFPLKYKIKYQWENRGSPKTVNLGPVETTKIELKELTPGQVYLFQVCAMELLGLGECSNWSSPLQVRSLVFLDQQVRLTGFSGGTGTKRERDREREKHIEISIFKNKSSFTTPVLSLQVNKAAE